MQARRHVTALAVLATLALSTFAGSVQAQEKIKVGFMLPYTGTFAALGVAIENGFRQYIDEQGGKLAGKTVEYVKVDDESDPAKAADNANKLVKRDNVDVMVGTVHSGVVMAMAKVAKDNNTLLIIPNAGANVVTGPLCAPNIFRSSFSNWQPGYAIGKVAAERKFTEVCIFARPLAELDAPPTMRHHAETSATMIADLGMPNHTFVHGQAPVCILSGALCMSSAAAHWSPAVTELVQLARTRWRDNCFVGTKKRFQLCFVRNFP